MPAVEPKPHVIEDEGNPLGFKPKLNFVGDGVRAFNQDNKTVVEVLGGQQGPPGPQGEPGPAGGAVSDINVKGFRSINAYGATQGGTAAANTNGINEAKERLVFDGGGKLFLPPGITDATPGLVADDGVDWCGSQRGGSILRFPTESAADTWAIVHNSVDGSRRPSFFDLTILGPGTGQVWGVPSATMRGVKLAYKSVMERCNIRQFYAGVSLYGDHNYFTDVDIEECHWGVELPESGILAKGNHSFTNCDLSGNTLCGVHVAGANTLDSSMFTNVHFGFGPFGLLREDYANATNADAAFMMNNAFVRCAWEYIGNSAFADLGSDHGQPSWFHNTIDGSGYSSSYPSGTATSYPRDYTIHLPGACIGGYIRNDFYEFQAGALGIYNLNGIVDVHGTHFLPKMFSGVGVFYDQSHDRFVGYPSSGTIVVGDLVEWTGTAVQRATGTTDTKVILGVAMTGTAASSIVLVKRGWTANSNVLGEAVVAGNLLAQITGTYHKVGLASSYPANPVIGQALSAGGNAGATAPVAVVSPRGFA